LNNAAGRANGNAQNGFMNQTPFFSDPGVRQQLNMTDTQFNTLNRNYQDAVARFNAQVNRLSPGLTADQRALQMDRLTQQFNQSLSGNLNSTLGNPQTVNRFNQLNRQFTGLNAFNDPTIRQQLNLSPDQLRQLRTVQHNFRQQLQQFRRGAGNDLNSVDQTQWNQLMGQYVSTLNNILTPEQQQMWQQQIGQPFTFSPTLFMNQQMPEETSARRRRLELLFREGPLAPRGRRPKALLALERQPARKARPKVHKRRPAPKRRRRVPQLRARQPKGVLSGNVTGLTLSFRS